MAVGHLTYNPAKEIIFMRKAESTCGALATRTVLAHRLRRGRFSEGHRLQSSEVGIGYIERPTLSYSHSGSLFLSPLKTSNAR